MSTKKCWESQEWQALKEHTDEVRRLHLRNLLQDDDRCKKMTASFGKDKEHGIYLDYSRQQVTEKTMGLLFQLAKSQKLSEKIQDMANGVHLNSTEDRAVMHMALRAPASAKFEVDGENVVPKVHSVLERIESFANKIRNGTLLGVTGKPLTDVVSIGIGGSYLGPEFLAEALKTVDVQNSYLA